MNILHSERDPADVLAPHARRRLRTLLARLPDDSAPEIIAIFDLVYAGHEDCDHETARAVHDELERTSRTVQELLDGWRPHALPASKETHHGRSH